jgi:RNA polymerase sigma-70 factor, ECF subfamily
MIVVARAPADILRRIHSIPWRQRAPGAWRRGIWPARGFLTLARQRQADVIAPLHADASEDGQGIADEPTVEMDAPTVKLGDEPFDDFFQRHERAVFGYLWHLTGSRELASDLRQETFVRAWRHYEKIRAYDKPLGWLLRVASNLALSHRQRTRGRGVDASGDQGGDDPAASDPAGHVVEQQLVRDTLLALPPKMRAALVLREVCGLSFAEVAETLDTTPAAAKMTLSRAREQFRERYLRAGGRL